MKFQKRKLPGKMKNCEKYARTQEGRTMRHMLYLKASVPRWPHPPPPLAPPTPPPGGLVLHPGLSPSGFAPNDIRKRSRRDQNDFQFNAFTCGHLSVFLHRFPASFKWKNFAGCILREKSGRSDRQSDGAINLQLQFVH